MVIPITTHNSSPSRQESMHVFSAFKSPNKSPLSPINSPTKSVHFRQGPYIQTPPFSSNSPPSTPKSSRPFSTVNYSSPTSSTNPLSPSFVPRSILSNRRSSSSAQRGPNLSPPGQRSTFSSSPPGAQRSTFSSSPPGGQRSNFSSSPPGGQRLSYGASPGGQRSSQGAIPGQRSSHGATPGGQRLNFSNGGNYAPSPGEDAENREGVAAAAQSFERAVGVLEVISGRDGDYPSLFQALVGRDQSGGLHPVSGYMEQDYPNVMERGLISKKIYTIEHNTPIPEALKNLLSQSEAGSCHMGLFPEIYRAWMTIGSDLYLWDFRDGTDLSFYDGIKESIYWLTMCPVRENVFKSNIKHVLCVTTASQIFILGFILNEELTRGLGLSPSKSKTTMEVIAQPIFTLSTEGVKFSIVVGAQNGRIFLGGSDGSIHEIIYQASSGWLHGRCYKSNLTKSLLSSLLPSFLSPSPSPLKDLVVDSERGFVYGLGEGGGVSAWWMGENGDGWYGLGGLSRECIVESVVVVSKRSVESGVVGGIVSLSTIESGGLNLVAMTETGLRLYFTCYSNPSQLNSSSPSNLKLAHIRLPPGHSPSSTGKRPSPAALAHYSAGLYTICSNSLNDTSMLWFISPFPYPTASYSELSASTTINGRVIEIREIPPGVPPPLLDLPQTLTQHLGFRRALVVLTSHGTLVLRASQPYENLMSLLEERGAEGARGHFEMMGSRVGPLANAVLVAMHPFVFNENGIQEQATKCIYMYGGATEVNLRSAPSPKGRTATFDVRSNAFESGSADGGYVSPPTSPTSPNSPWGSPPLSSTLLHSPSPHNFNNSGTHNWNNMANNMGPNLGSLHMGSNVGGSGMGGGEGYWAYSPRHDGIYAVAGRVLTPFWNKRIVRVGRGKGGARGGNGPNIIIPNVSGDEVTLAIHYLQSLHNFIINNPSLYMTSYKFNLNYSQVESTPEGRKLQAYEMEKNSMAALKNFLSLALEVLGLWKILCDHQFHIVLKGIDDRMLNTTMKELIVNGQNTTSFIINSLVSKYLGDNAAVDAISVRLRDVCPTLFKNEDAIGTKVAEILTKAQNTTNPSEREDLLRSSLTLCTQICGHGHLDIRNFCHQYATLNYPLGAIKLCESAAAAVDPNNKAVSILKGNGNNDPSTNSLYNARSEIYKIALDMLDMFTTSASSPSSDSRQLSIENSETSIRAIQESGDELFHVALYNWLLEHKDFDKLLSLSHPFLDSYLERAGEGRGGRGGRGAAPLSDTLVLDLLWRYYEKSGNNLGAAQILVRLADSPSGGLDFHQRFEYLSRANICMKGLRRGGNYNGGEVLEALEDKLEVATIQKMILDNLVARSSGGGSGEISGERQGIEEAVLKLNSQLFNLTALYAEFALPFKLNEIKLEIFSSSGHSDKLLIESLWADIIEAELSSNSRTSMEAQMEIIRRKIVKLGRKYLADPNFFPLEYLVEHLEAMKPNEPIHTDWVVKIMLEIGVPFTDLIHVYDGLWKKLSHRQPSSSLTHEVQLARVLMSIVKMFIEGQVELRLKHLQMTELVERCKDALAGMIVEFSSKFEPEATATTAELKIIKERLDQLRF